MSDSRGISEKAIQRNAMKMVPPAYVTHAKTVTTGAEHKNGKNRNEPCMCGSGLKTNKCCGK